MSAPQVLGITEGLQTTDAITWTLSYPQGCSEGELVLFIMAINGNPNPTSVSTADFVSAVGFGNGVALGKRLIPAGGASGTFTVTLNAAESGCWKVLRIGPWDGTLGINFVNSDSNGGMVPAGSYSDATGTNPDPAGLSPFGWDGTAEKTLYIGVCVANDGGVTFTGMPLGADVVGANQNSGGGAAGAALSAVSKQVQAEPYDVGSWTLSASTLFRALVVAVRGGTSGEANSLLYWTRAKARRGRRFTTLTK